MEDDSGRPPVPEPVHALLADAARARERAHQRAVAAGRLSERAAAARRDAERARERAARMR